MSDLDRYEALIDEADRTRKETIKCVCGEIYARDDEDHEATDCLGCNRTLHRCMAHSIGDDFPYCVDCASDVENNPAYGDHIDEEIDRIKEARSEGH